MQYIAENIKDFNLDHIFDCGQCFRWERQLDGSYTGIAKGKIVNMRYERDDFDKEDKEDGGKRKADGGRAGRSEAADGTDGAPKAAADGTDGAPKAAAGSDGAARAATPRAAAGKAGAGRLIIDNCTEEEFQNIWRPYLDLDRDYGKIKGTLSEGDPVMGRAVKHGDGIRILRQDLWETILSFIISQNNHIPRIKGCIEKLAELFGQPAGIYEGRAWRNLPGPEVLARLSEADLAEVRLGYRSKYILGTARAVVRDGLPRDAQQLAALPGVGPKVAACVLLFGMGKYDAFPVDVWMARVMHQLYGLDQKDRRAMEAYAAEHFGQLGGFAQQYLFYYIRSLHDPEQGR